MNTLLVTGGQGFVGSRIIKMLGGESYDLKSSLDILDEPRLQTASQDKNAIVHCAAKISVPESFKIPQEYYRTNVEGTASVIKAAETNKNKIVFFSSAAVYGDSSKKVTEEDVLNPKSPYASNKRDGEELLKKSSVPHIALRPFNIYGPGQSPQYAGVITHFITAALAHKDVTIFGDGNHVRDFIFIDDIVSAVKAATEYKNTQFEVFNIGSGVETTMSSLAELIIKLTNSSSKIVFKPNREGDIVYSQADVSKAEKLLNFKAKISLTEGLKRTVTNWH